MSIAWDKMLALTLAIITLAAGIIFYTKYISPKPVNCEICKNMFANWCNKCYINNFPQDEHIPEETCKCSAECNFISSSCSSPPSCKNLESECEPYLVKSFG